MDGCTSRHHSYKGGDAHTHTRGHSLTDLHPAAQGLQVHIPMVVASAGMKAMACSSLPPEQAAIAAERVRDRPQQCAASQCRQPQQQRLPRDQAQQHCAQQAQRFFVGINCASQACTR